MGSVNSSAEATLARINSNICPRARSDSAFQSLTERKTKTDQTDQTDRISTLVPELRELIYHSHGRTRG